MGVWHRRDGRGRAAAIASLLLRTDRCSKRAFAAAARRPALCVDAVAADVIALPHVLQ